VVGEVIAKSANVMLVFDDLHWASASMWDHLAALVDGFVPNGGLLVGAYRRPDIESTAGWSVLEGWDRRGLATLLRLGPLELGDVAELLGPGAEQPEDVVAVTGGVPFYITEWLHGSDGGRRADRATLTRRRLELLAPDHRRALECGAVLGEGMTTRAWLGVTGMPPLELARAGDELTTERWIAPTSSGHGFTHDLLRAAVYEQIPDTARRTLHERAAGVLAEVDPDNARARAFHLDRAALPAPAAAAYREAGRALRAEFAFNDALDAWSRALELLPKRRRRERLELGLDSPRSATSSAGDPTEAESSPR
jgi:predicted ATPase